MFVDSVIEINLSQEASSQRIESRRDREHFASGTRFFRFYFVWLS